MKVRVNENKWINDWMKIKKLKKNVLMNENG